jgi:hypothetical protein
MASRLADRLNIERQRRFVGRSAELLLFQQALRSPSLPFHVLHIYGPGGIGKTTLLHEFEQISAQSGVEACYLDARSVEPVAEAVQAALRLRMGLAQEIAVGEALARQAARFVLLIDSYEALAPLDGWLRDQFLPQISSEVLVVLASRDQPSLSWRTDPGWQGLIQLLPLTNLSRADSLGYLASRQVPPSQHAAVLDFTYGHPLALALVADLFAQRPNASFRPDDAPDMIRILLAQFVQRVPGPAHRAALEACALVRLTSEDLLGAMLSMPDVHELFEWLRDLSFIEQGGQGLFPHDLVREALDLDLRWRNPPWYAELHRRARAYYAAQIPQGSLRQQQRSLADYIFLHRHSPAVRPFFEWRAGGNLLPESARPADWPALLAMITRHEGAAAAQIAAHWYARQPEGLLVLRTADGSPAGLLWALDLSHIEPAELQADPAVTAAWGYLQGQAPLRPGEQATLFRFWMADESYQDVSAVQSLIFVHMVAHYLTTPGLAFSFLPCARPDFWAAAFSYADLRRIPEADFTVGGRAYGVYGHDWRSVPPLAWLALLAERETASEEQLAASGAASAPGLLVLAEDEFAEAIREALRNLSRSDALASSPLLRSRLVARRAGAQASVGERVAALQELIRASCEQLHSSPRDLKLYRALYHTYLQPAATQELAAELLDLPFSTFRRHLREGIARVTASLWQAEL